MSIINSTTSHDTAWLESSVEGASAGDIATFIDENCNEVLRLSPARPFLFNGLTFDDSASDLAAGDFIMYS